LAKLPLLKAKAWEIGYQSKGPLKQAGRRMQRHKHKHILMSLIAAVAAVAMAQTTLT
jgi:hypothetical protein